MSNDYILISSITIFSVLFVGSFIYKQNGKGPNLLEEYILAGKTLNQGSILSSLSASNAALANIVFLYAYWGYAYGIVAALWGAVFWACGLGVFYIAIYKGRLSQLIGSNQTALGFSEIVSNSFVSNTNVRRSVALVTGLAFLFLMTLEIGVGSNAVTRLVSNSPGISQGYSIDSLLVGAILTSIVAFYGYIGGFRMVVNTDSWQLPLIIIGLSGSLYLVEMLLRTNGSSLIGLLQSEFSTFSLFKADVSYLSFVVGSIFSWGLWFLCTADSWQRGLAADGRSLKRIEPATILVGLLILIFVTTVAAIIGIAVKQSWLGEIPPKYPVIEFISSIRVMTDQNFAISAALIAMITGFIAAMASTVDTYMIIVGQALGADMIERRSLSVFSMSENEDEPKRVLRNIRIVSIVSPFVGLALFSGAHAWGNQDNFTMYMLAGSLPLCIAPVALVSIFCKNDAKLDGRYTSIFIILSLIITLMANFYLANQALLTFDYRYFSALYFTPVLAFVVAGIGLFLDQKFPTKRS